MSNIYITGHRNPDIDSICSALGYADLKNMIDPANTYIPVRCSHLGETTKKLLAAMNITPPPFMRDVFPKISDVMLTSGTRLDADTLLTDYARQFDESAPPAVPVFDGEQFLGLVCSDDVVSWTMQELAKYGRIEHVPTMRQLVREQHLRLMTDDLFRDGKHILSQSKKRGIPVFDGDRYAGFVSRRCFLNTPRYDVVLVDHNEASHSIAGIETANVVEIIDHHRLNTMKTDVPLFIDAEPLGSTCTIVYQLFLRNGIRPNPQTARILLGGIVSDTIILKSPTTTDVDRESAHSLALRCGTTVEEYGRAMFSTIEGLASRPPESAITADFKQYAENGVRVGIGQCEATTLQDVNEYFDTYAQALERVRQQQGLDWALLMVTDVIKENSILISTEYKAERHLQYTGLAAHLYDMPGVMSRKKQLFPEIAHSLRV